jgi:hypothetical protein
MNGEIRLSAFRAVSPACVLPQFELQFKDREEIEQPFFCGAAPVKRPSPGNLTIVSGDLPQGRSIILGEGLL